jgi:pyrroline-5-carboxylate reductase
MRESSITKLKKICFIGAGNMVEALIQGILAAGLFRRQEMLAADSVKDRLEYIREKYGIKVTGNNKSAVEWADLVVLAVKPQVMDLVLEDIRKAVDDSKILISIAAGIPISKIFDGLTKEAKVIRVMPNTPALVKEGASAIAPGRGILQPELALVRKIFESIGKAVVVDERLMDAVTGLSGSGPAYIFLVIEAMADGGVKMGLSRDVAQLLAAQTVLGAAKLVLETGEHPGRLKDMVASPAGTTMEGLHRLEAGGLRALFISAIEGATKRSQDLGGSRK